jgi:hypothetical protein
MAGDYAASQVANDSSVAGFTVKDALNTLLAAGGGVVSSVFGRVGAVVAANGDYTTSQVTNASTVTGATATAALNTIQTHLTSLDGSVVSLGALISGLQASNIGNNSSGPGASVADTLSAYNIHLTSLDGSVVSLGSLITNLKASNIGNDSSVSGTTVKDALNTLGKFGEIVADNTARDAIPAGLRAVGTIAYVAGTDLSYRLIGGTANANWADISVYPLDNTHAGIVPAITVANAVLNSNGAGTAGSWAQIVDAVVSATAAISGLKVSPNFGNQAIVNTTFVSIGGATVPAAGTIRVPALTTMRGYDNSGGTNAFNIITWGVTTSNTLRIGDTTNAITALDGGAGVQFATAGVTRITLDSGLFQVLPVEIGWNPGVITPPIFRCINVSGSATIGDMTIRGQGSTNAGNVNGSGIRLQGGKAQNTALMGHVTMQLNLNDATFYDMCEVANVLGTARVLSLCRTVPLTSVMMPANSGDGVINLANAATAPTAAPGSGCTVFATGGNLGWFTPNATKTTIGAAGGAAAVPALPVEYATINFNGNARAIALYNP